MTGASLIRGDALRIPLRDESVDLIVTSPPYFALRSYQDGGEHYAGQIGSEATPQAFIDALIAVTAECKRVLKPSGSMFVNLGDKYSGTGGPGGDYNPGGNRSGQPREGAKEYWARNKPASTGIPAKSLMLLPERYRIAAVDQLGLIARAVVIWDKPNGLPESVTDRVRRSHEDWVHLTKQPRYYAAVDEIREPHTHPANGAVFGGKKAVDSTQLIDASARRQGQNTYDTLNPLGKLPGSVWRIASEPLQVPAHVGVDHFAAFPQEWPRRIILGWTPPGHCCACGQPRTAVVDKRNDPLHVQGNKGAAHLDQHGNRRLTEVRTVSRTEATITGYRCACPTPDAPTRPAIVLDPFSGTGTTVMVARALGRYGIGIDLSADYLRLARWRIHHSGHAAKTLNRTWTERQGALL